jgi:Trypsin-like peptidase domain
MIQDSIRKAVEAATVRFTDRGGQGVLVPGGFILTATHVVKWTTTGAMALGDEVEFIQEIEAGGCPLQVYPLAVEPVADLAVLGALDSQWHPEAADAFRRFCMATRAIPLATAEMPFDEPVPAHVLAHTGRWISGRVRQMCFDAQAETLVLDPDEQVEPGTSGSPVVMDDGLLLGVVSTAAEGGDRSSTIARPHLAAPVWLVRQMLPAIKLASTGA